MAQKKKIQKTNTLPKDPATQYALDVGSGKIIAGPHVRDACKRHLDDLDNGHKRGLSWHVEEVDRVVGFFKDVCTVEVEYTDEFGDIISEAIPFIAEPSQAFIVGSLFGWKKNGIRRFRRAYIEQGKGSGKSPMSAAIGHYMLTAYGKLRAEIYSAATDKDQAAILFRDAVEMWRRSPALSSRLVSSGQNPVWQLTYIEKASFFKPISSEKKGKSGIRPFCALIDEVHEHRDDSVIEMLRAGTKGNREALIFEITNSGHDKTSVCWSEHEYTIKVCSGAIENDGWFGYVCALDEDDEPFENEDCWIKANPLLGITIQPEFIREQVQEAKGMPSKEGLVRRLHFCQWTDSLDGWISRKAWESVEQELDQEEYKDKECYGGLDMSYTSDLSAAAWVYPDEKGEIFDAFVDFFKPKEGLDYAARRDKVPYDLWSKDGFLRLTEGKVIKLGPIALRMAEINDTSELKGIAYDRYRHRELADDMVDMNIELPLTEHPQGFRRMGVLKDENGEQIKDENGKPVENPLWMPSSLQHLENLIKEENIRIHINPILKWNAASAVIRQDPAGTDNRIFDKRRSTSRIDGIVALAMAVGLAKSKIQTRNVSVYETRGVRTY